MEVRIPTADRALLRRAAAAEGGSVSELVREAALRRACRVLGLDVRHYLATGEERERRS